MNAERAERVDLDELEAFYSHIDFDRSPQVVAACRELRVARGVGTQIRQLVDAAEFLIRNDKTAQPQFVLAELVMDIRGVLAHDRHDPPAGGDQAEDR
jgi:hypothetical protein